MDEFVRERFSELSEKITLLQTKTNYLEKEVKELTNALLIALNEIKKLKEKQCKK